MSCKDKICSQRAIGGPATVLDSSWSSYQTNSPQHEPFDGLGSDEASLVAEQPGGSGCGRGGEVRGEVLLSARHRDRC